MHIHSPLVVLAFGCLVLWANPLIGDVETAKDRAAGYSPSLQDMVGDLPCVRAKTCRIQRIRRVSSCPGMKVVETIPIPAIPTDYLTNPDAAVECIRQDHWLIRGDGSPPVLLVAECLHQERPGQPGASATHLVGCDLFFRHFNEEGPSCRIRELGIHLDTLQPFGEIESDGVPVRYHGYAVNPATRRAIRLPLGAGIASSPLIAIDGPDRKSVV